MGERASPVSYTHLNFGTVVQVGEYVALLLGYKRIELYGVDHTLLDGL